ncbi:DEKNAAC103673 [Brettanomyces naardenensis]|uniref:DEKNAAC103673 n=1 Tax=Brettanomyces naardenensis TaxID=13370 RepID=A0A448YNT5_BRENA|nr:DEKNAAC103673 [Brettanomyces naardenensis]
MRNGAPPTEHPAEGLSRRVGEDAKRQLLATPPKLLIENPVYGNILSRLRSNFKFCYLVQWLYLLRRLIHMKDSFDVEDIEEEITGIADPPMFLNTFKTKLIQYLVNYKMRSARDEFPEQVDRILGDKEEEEEGGIGYDSLDLEGKIDILYQLVKKANDKSPDHFRKIVSTYEESDNEENMRLTPVFQVVDENFREEYFMLKDARLYYRKWEFQPMEVPKRRRDYFAEIKEPAYLYFEDFEPVLVEWKCLTTGIYEFDAYVQDMKAAGGRKKRSSSYRLAGRLDKCYDQVIDHDLRKRRQALQRKKEVKMQYLLAHRKRSSRLLEKEQQKKEEEDKQREEDERLQAEAADRRAERRIRMKEQQYSLASASSRSRSRSMSPGSLAKARAERELKRRKIQSEIANPTRQEEKWQFDCTCGIKQENYDDGTKMIGCDQCSRWQHYNCQPDQVKHSIDNDPNYKFVCSYCRTNESQAGKVGEVHLTTAGEADMKKEEGANLRVEQTQLSAAPQRVVTAVVGQVPEQVAAPSMPVSLQIGQQGTVIAPVEPKQSIAYQIAPDAPHIFTHERQVGPAEPVKPVQPVIPVISGTEVTPENHQPPLVTFPPRTTFIAYNPYQPQTPHDKL